MQKGSGLTAIDVLSAFNGAVVARKLYPVSAPQVASHLERGFKTITDFFSQGQSFSIAVHDDGEWLCGQPLATGDMDAISNLVVFRHLRQLGLNALFLDPETDKFTFHQVVSFFSASKQQVDAEGGGLNYAISLGLASCFPGSVAASEPVEAKKSQNVSGKVSSLLLAALFTPEPSDDVSNKLRDVFSEPSQGAELMAAGIGRMLVALGKRKNFVSISEFSDMLLRVEAMVVEAQQKILINQLCDILIPRLSAQALALLLYQNYPEGFGRSLYYSLIDQVSNDNLNLVYNLFCASRDRRAALGNKELEARMQGCLELLQTHPRVKSLLEEKNTQVAASKVELETLQKQLESDLNKLKNKDFSSLEKQDFVDHLFPLSSCYSLVSPQEGAEFLALVCQGVEKIAHTVQGPLVAQLLLIGEKLLADRSRLMLRPIMAFCYTWMQKSSLASAVYEDAASLLYRIGVSERQRGGVDSADKIMGLFYGIRSGTIAQSATVKALVARVQDREVDRRSFPVLLEDYLQNPQDEARAKRLLFQGSIVKRYLVDVLIGIEDADKRADIINLLQQNTLELESIVLERLKEDMPWYGKRNLLKLLTECGTQASAKDVLEYIKHRDLRVQREAVSCLEKIAGTDCDLLLRALENSSGPIRLQIIKGLAPFKEERIAELYCQLLEEYGEAPSKENEPVVLALLTALWNYPLAFVQQSLGRFLVDQNENPKQKYDKSVCLVAEKLNGHIDDQLDAKGQGQHVMVSSLRKQNKRQATRLVMQDGSGTRYITDERDEVRLRDFIKEGDFDGASHVFLSLIGQLVARRKFTQAEKIREWLIDQAPGLLAVIIRAAEMIEDGKNVSIKREHLEVWGELYDVLTTEEFTALYHCLNHVSLQDSQVIVRQGSKQKALYFINQGLVKLTYSQGGNEGLITSLGPGSVLGAGAFFDASVWTISVSCLRRTEISILEFKDVKELFEEHPALESKLRDFCVKFEKLENYFKKSSKDRRVYPRSPVCGRVAVQLLDQNGKFVGSMPRGDLADISEGGVSFLSRFSRKEYARMLLGRKVVVTLPVKNNEGIDITCIGQVLGVRTVAGIESEYSVHIKFDENLEHRDLDKIVYALKSKLK